MSDRQQSVNISQIFWTLGNLMRLLSVFPIEVQEEEKEMMISVIMNCIAQ